MAASPYYACCPNPPNLDCLSRASQPEASGKHEAHNSLLAALGDVISPCRTTPRKAEKRLGAG